jgi:hypothetical protein
MGLSPVRNFIARPICRYKKRMISSAIDQRIKLEKALVVRDGFFRPGDGLPAGG